MGRVRGFSELYTILDEGSEIKKGCIIDTSALFAAAYEPDSSHDTTAEFTDLIAENEIPLFYNVNIRSEFLELFRRVIFTEVLLDFEKACDKSKLPTELSKDLTKLRKRYDTALANKKEFRPIPDKELKDNYKKVMTGIRDGSSNLWDILCTSRVSGKLADEWKRVENEFGLNPLTTRGTDQSPQITGPLNWEDAVDIMEKTGLASADAMISNIFANSTIEFLITNDLDIMLAASKLDKNKTVLAPDELIKKYQNLF